MARRKPDTKLLLTFDEVRDALRPVSRNTVYALFRSGEIPGGKRLGGRWYAIKAAFDREMRDGKAA